MWRTHQWKTDILVRFRMIERKLRWGKMFSGVGNAYFSGWGLTATRQCGKNLLYQEGRSSKCYLRTNKIVLWYMSENLQKKIKVL